MVYCQYMQTAILEMNARFERELRYAKGGGYGRAERAGLILRAAILPCEACGELERFELIPTVARCGPCEKDF